MAIAGYCRQCGQNVYLDDKWGCPHGHSWEAISGWYDTDTRNPITPPWMQGAASPQPAPQAGPPTPPVEPAPIAAQPEAAPPPDPAVALRRLIRNRLEELNLKVTEKKGVYSASRGKEYEVAVAVDGVNGRVLLWERLRSGRDPGVRDAVRTLAGANWTVKIVLKREAVRE
ncbi:MAG: hypothetical protein JXA36_05615 [Coriobacteriia bacterium]|nr:hypothetical protein [Coriobacteriia bacterium]